MPVVLSPERIEFATLFATLFIIFCGKNTFTSSQYMVWSHSGSFSWRSLRKDYSYNCLPQELAPELIKAGTRDIKTKERKKSNDNLQNKITEGKTKKQKQKTKGKQKQRTEFYS